MVKKLIRFLIGVIGMLIGYLLARLIQFGLIRMGVSGFEDLSHTTQNIVTAVFAIIFFSSDKPLTPYFLK